MECYSHGGVPAVAICRVCGKAVCHECALELSAGGVVCSELCSAKIAESEASYICSRKSFASKWRVYFLLCGLLSVLGVISAWQRQNYWNIVFFFLLGIVFAVIAVISRRIMQVPDGGSKTGDMARST
jgi:hypothetical protein